MPLASFANDAVKRFGDIGGFTANTTPSQAASSAFRGRKNSAPSE
jgi:hypothetical protein